MHWQSYTVDVFGKLVSCCNNLGPKIVLDRAEYI